MKIIDLRSDTITLPTEEMRKAMYEAELGDDVHREDPTVNRLEEIAAQIMGKEAALFTASGTMSNLIAVLAHTHRGDAMIVGSESHILWHELGNSSVLAGVVLRIVPNTENGELVQESLIQAFQEESTHYPRTTLLSIENTHNRCYGSALTPEYTRNVSELTHKHGLKVHLDGARIFNAAVTLGIPAEELTQNVDSVFFSLSKSLSAPVGSILCGTTSFIESARKWRKMLGGGMRQVGTIAAAGIVALEKMIGRLADDHFNARRFAEGLSQIPGFSISPEKVQTNIVNFEPPQNTSDFLLKAKSYGVQFSSPTGQIIRAVTHRMVTTDDIDEALTRLQKLVRQE